MPRALEELDEDGFLNPVDPGVTAKVDKALADSVTFPTAEMPPDTLVTLPGGLVHGDSVITHVEVRELTGEHEEAMSRAARAQPGNLLHFVNTLLECGTVRFGQEDPAKTRQYLQDALVGDRDAILLGIRRATYGDEIELPDWQCPECENLSDLKVPLDDIPVHELKYPAKDIVFDVPLRRGRTAEVRLANGADQTAVFENAKLSAAERDTILLSRCLLAIRDKDGTRHVTTGNAAATARGLSLADRHAILKQLLERQPGPQFGDLKFTHADCSKEVDLVIGMTELFRDLNMA